ncbi:DUF1501 domain-containing protein [Olleya namhaensis]|uniref:DUF1501 domain-containing protein n=1 Tax=Olleya namhaensis TaxID=1144750 RepID=UPI002490CAAB|nr:DUF1501 domain-containing protein [Olleya namhaensis]
MDRRKFIKNSVLASGLTFMPSFLKAFETIDVESIGYKRLVIVQLTGGNDGLNTIVPVRNDIYYKSRPKIAIPKNQTIKLNDDLGFHKSLKPLKRLYDKGELCIINNVGYPNPIRSHFRSSDIWHTASRDKYQQVGWIGRYLDHYGTNAHEAIDINKNLTLAFKGQYKNGIATKSAMELYRSLQESDFNTILTYQNSQKHLNEHNLGYLYRTMIDVKSSAKYLYEKTSNTALAINYPKSSLGNQLRTVAQFINSRVATKVFYTSVIGFDTHSNQVAKQERLLANYADSMEVFVQDLKKNNTFKDTLILSFSEFGRRVDQNYSNGTDHGAANNLYVIGDQLKKPGLYNDLDTLQNLDDNGDIKYEIDFRTIYATILDKWLNVSDKKVLNKSFSKLDFI